MTTNSIAATRLRHPRQGQPASAGVGGDLSPSPKDALKARRRPAVAVRASTGAASPGIESVQEALEPVVVLAAQHRKRIRLRGPYKARARRPAGHRALTALRRRSAGKTIETVARECCVSHQTVRNWEMGICTPLTTRLTSYARALGISLEVLEEILDQPIDRGDGQTSHRA